jgi:hypothetical protein
MRIRNGFVSNSSSSSFLIYGWCIEDIKKVGEVLKVESGGKYDIINELEKLLLKNDLGVIHGQDDHSIYIGRSWDSIGDNETGGQFKKSIEEDIEKLLPGIKKVFGTHEEAWYDG